MCCSVAHVRPWQDPLLCQVISGQMFGDELLEAKPVVQQRLDALEAENRCVVYHEYMPSFDSLFLVIDLWKH